MDKKQKPKEFSFSSGTKDINEIDISILLRDLEKTKDSNSFGEMLIENFASEVEILQALFFIRRADSIGFTIAAGYPDKRSTDEFPHFIEGVGLNGEAAANNHLTIIKDLPVKYLDNSLNIKNIKQFNLLFLPLAANGRCIALAEFATPDSVPVDNKEMLRIFAEKAGPILYNIMQ